MRDLAEHLGGHDDGTDAEALLKKAQEAQQRADLVRQVVMSHEHLSKSKLGQKEKEA
jgi:hypothetical protein